MAEDVTEDAGNSGDKPERPSAALAMVNDALARLKAADPDLTIAELERRRGLPKGTLAHPLKPANRGRVPRQPTIRALSDALNIDAAKLGKAFMTDYLGDGDEETIHQQRAADLIGTLPAHLQRLAIRHIEVVVEHYRASEAASATQADDERGT